MNEENSVQPTSEAPVSEATSVSKTSMSESTSDTETTSVSESLSDSTSETTSEIPASTSTACTNLNSTTTSGAVEVETPTRTLDDVIPGDGTNRVWISGELAGRNFDCEGPIELSVKMTKPIWPFVTIEPNSQFEHQKFNYSTGVWEPLDEATIGQQVINLAEKVEKLSQPDTEAAQFNMQTTKALFSLTKEVQNLSKKFDTKVGGNE